MIPEPTTVTTSASVPNSAAVRTDAHPWIRTRAQPKEWVYSPDATGRYGLLITSIEMSNLVWVCVCVGGCVCVCVCVCVCE
jgi:hypothetical protein